MYVLTQAPYTCTTRTGRIGAYYPVLQYRDRMSVYSYSSVVYMYSSTSIEYSHSIMVCPLPTGMQAMFRMPATVSEIAFSRARFK